MSLNKTFDVIIAGGGTAGCVLASRLSEDPNKQVLLVEAGADVAAPGAEHPDVLDPFCLGATRNSELQWPGLVAETLAETASGAARILTPYWQGYGVGGSSNINGMAADRGLPEDYDEWSDRGVRGWAWKDVLPYFRKLEHELDLISPDPSSSHGHGGPMPVRRLPRASWAPFPTAVGEALERRGFTFIEDYMTDSRDGFSGVPTNCLPHQRVSAAMAYLTREVRSRRNLQIISRARVDRLRLDGRRATGVLIRVDGATTLALGRQIIVSCGAIQSPALLMRSGIGPGDVLLRQGIAVVKDLPGVGANLQNHPCVSLIMYLRREASQPVHNRWFLQNWLRFSSNLPGCHSSDMHLMAFNRCGWHTLGRRIGMLALSLLKPYSAGSVELASGDPVSSPTVRFNLFADSRDEERLVNGMRFALELLIEPVVARLRHEMFLPNPRWVMSLERRNVWNDLKSRAIASILDRSLLRRLAFGSSRLDPGSLMSDHKALRRFVRERTHVQAHACGTCRLGTAGDRNAVVDGAGRVHGIDGLRVADASIFPRVPRGYPHFIVIMVAEKIADAIKSDWRS